MTLYAGLDISVRSVAICIVDHNGAVRLERSLPSEVPVCGDCERVVAGGRPLGPRLIRPLSG